jgi:DUF1680 family protein
MWNWRLLGITGDARFADMMEQVLYNSGLSGLGLQGKTYLYTNPLRWHGGEVPLLEDDTLQRWTHRHGYCCPPQILRTITKIHGWTYSISTDGLYVNLYGANLLDTELSDGTKLKLEQQTDYPWKGEVGITLLEVERKEFSIFLRIPSWTKGAGIAVNGTKVEGELIPGEYAEVKRAWATGDMVTLSLPMQVRLLEADPRVESLGNQAAVQRGPIIYCLESPDLPDTVKVSEVVIPQNIRLLPRHAKNFLGGVTVLEGEAYEIAAGDWFGQLYRVRKPTPRKNLKIKLIPYYAWNNRGISHMTVWLPVDL